MRETLKKVLNVFGKKDTPNFYRLYVRELISEKTKNKRRVLEVGCSKGETYVCSEDQIYVGVDFDIHYLEGFRESIKDSEYFLVQADATRLSFADNLFDAVYSFQTFMIMNEDQVRVALKEFSRVSNSDAIFLFDFLNRNSIQFLFTRNQYWDNDPRFFYRGLSCSDAKKMLNDAGYEIVDLKPILVIPYFITLKLGWKWLFKLDLLLGKILPYFACRNIFICRKRDS